MPPRKDESRIQLVVVVDEADNPAYVDAVRVPGTERARIVASLLAPPSTPLQTQEQGQLTNDEATVTLTNFTGTGADVLDKDTATEIVVTDPTAVSQIRVDPNQPMFVGYIGGRPGALGSLPTIVTITVTDINGATHQKFVRLGAGLTADGIDTDPFSIIPAIRIDIDFGVAGLGNDYDVSQVVIYKAKGRQYTNRYPQPVQARQELTIDDIESITLTPGGPGVWTGDPEVLFDKDLSPLTEVYYDGAGFPASIVINLKSQTRIPAMSIYSSLLVGFPLRGTTIDIVDVTSTLIRVHGVASGIAEDGISETFQPIDATQIIIQFNSPAVTPIRVAEIVIYKAIETQASLNRNADAIIPLLTAVTVSNGTPIAGDPVAPGVGIDITAGPNPAMAGSGTLMEKNNNQAMSAQIRITAAAGITTISVGVDWYYSDDNVTFHYGGTFFIFDTTAPLLGNPNPTGFQAAGGVSYWMINHGIDSFNRYIALAIRNDDAVNDVVASAELVKQR